MNYAPLTLQKFKKILQLRASIANLYRYKSCYIFISEYHFSGEEEEGEKEEEQEEEAQDVPNKKTTTMMMMTTPPSTSTSIS